MTKLTIVATGVVLCAAWGAGAAAQPVAPEARERRGRMERPERGPGRDWAALQREVGLTEEQAAALRRLRAEERKQAIRRRADLAIARVELEEALEAATVDEKLIATRVRAVSELQAAALRARVDRRLALRKVLTPEQRDKVRQLRRERGAAGRGVRTGARPAEPVR